MGECDGTTPSVSFAFVAAFVSVVFVRDVLCGGFEDVVEILFLGGSVEMAWIVFSMSYVASRCCWTLSGESCVSVFGDCTVPL